MHGRYLNRFYVVSFRSIDHVCKLVHRESKRGPKDRKKLHKELFNQKTFSPIQGPLLNSFEQASELPSISSLYLQVII